LRGVIHVLHYRNPAAGTSFCVLFSMVGFEKFKWCYHFALAGIIRIWKSILSQNSGCLVSVVVFDKLGKHPSLLKDFPPRAQARKTALAEQITSNENKC
jgi:hypothetical protein